MLKRLSWAAMVGAMLLGSGQSQDLSTVCLSGTGTVDSLLGAGAVTALPNVSVEGTCDSVSVVYDTLIGGIIPLRLPVATIKKLNSCSLNVSILVGAASDTTYDYCALTRVFHRIPTGDIPLGSALLHCSYTAKGAALIDYSLPMPGARLQLADIKGNIIRTFPTQRSSGTVLWDGVDSRGKQVPAGRYVLMMRAGSYVKSIDVMKVRN